MHSWEHIDDMRLLSDFLAEGRTLDIAAILGEVLQP